MEELIDLIHRKELHSKGYWEVPEGLDTSMFDFNWRPNVMDPPMIHHFGTQWHDVGGPKFIIPEHDGFAIHTEQKVIKLDNMPKYNIKTTLQDLIIEHPNETFWAIYPNVDTNGFDFSWHPYPLEDSYVHHFGTQLQQVGGVTYVMPNNVGTKLQTFATVKELGIPIYDIETTLKDLVAIHPDETFWAVPKNIDRTDFNFNWRPEPYEQPIIHRFGTQWQLSGGPCYVVSGYKGFKFCLDQQATAIDILPKYDVITNLEDLLQEHPNENFYAIYSNTDITNFDFSWHPDVLEKPYVHVFGTQWQENNGVSYVCANNIGIKLQNIQQVSHVPDKIYVIETTLSDLMKKHSDETFWAVSKNIDLKSFDFSWHPDLSETKFLHQFGTQWQKTHGPIYVVPNNEGTKYQDCQKCIILADSNNRFWRPLLSNCSIDYSWHPDDTEPPYMYVFGNQWYDAQVMPTFIYRVPGAEQKKYITDITGKLLPNLENWIIPDDVDDTDFDYSWKPHPGEPPLIHQFGTQWQRSGGPSYVANKANGIKYESFMKAIKKPNIRNWRIIEPIDKETFDFSWHPDSIEENYNHIFGCKFHTPEILPTLMYRGHKDAKSNKYSSDLQADLQIEKIVYEDSIFDACKEHKFSTAYAHFVKGPDNYVHDLIKNDNVSVHLFPSEAIIPRAAVLFFYDKLTDYDYVVQHEFDETVQPLDIIFFSNGEVCADENYEHLLSLNLPNRIMRVDGVKGRVASQHAAANASNTPWYFLVNAKLKVNENFDFNWQPNIYKSRRHYIFTATNPLNGLEYGHQAIVANNKKLTLNTVVRGLDFTMDSKTEVLSVNSGISTFNSSPWDTWRTAFREVIKLKHYNDIESKNRLEAWLTLGDGLFGSYSIKGANDAVKYYEEVNGEFDKLMLTYDWEYLENLYINTMIE